MDKDRVYIFIDESGSLAFKGKDSTYFILTCLITRAPLSAFNALPSLRYEILTKGEDVEYFHASNNTKKVREKVFSEIINIKDRYSVLSHVINKNKLPLELKKEESLYPIFFIETLKGINNLKKDYKITESTQLIFITDALPVQRKRKIITKSIKKEARRIFGKRCYVYHHQSKADYNLQVADYFGWAVFRMWERQDRLWYDQLVDVIWLITRR